MTDILQNLKSQREELAQAVTEIDAAILAIEETRSRRNDSRVNPTSSVSPKGRKVRVIKRKMKPMADAAYEYLSSPGGGSATKEEIMEFIEEVHGISRSSSSLVPALSRDERFVSAGKGVWKLADTSNQKEGEELL